ncbi:Nif3-like dinuclear metal center hexameric protein [Ruminococcaceae bacterium OttesenSCG-928-I18]|nr:Nif3-like dinuclear metal center hexameric protein [Ruminococcaceae bacterium OttesenSCG-928-I18]
MPKIAEIAEFIESVAPAELAEEWDNSGTLVDCGGEVRGILCALDITNAVVREAETGNCQLIVAHHPVIFHPLRKIGHGDIVYRLVRKHISAICAHTNLDAATGGVNDILSAIFGVLEPEPFARVGRVGVLRQPTSATKLAESCAERFSAHVRYVDAGKPVHKLAIMGGSGGGLLEEALEAGADCILTGEADHHDAVDAREAGVSLIVAGHYSTEFPVVPVMADRLIKRFPDVTVLISRKGKDPFKYADPK